MADFVGECAMSPLVVSIFYQLASENEEVGGVDLKDYASYSFWMIKN